MNQHARWRSARYAPLTALLAFVNTNEARAQDFCSIVGSLGWPLDATASTVTHEQWRRAVRFYKYDTGSDHASARSTGISAVIPLSGVLVPLGFEDSREGYSRFRNSALDFTDALSYSRFTRHASFTRINSAAIRVFEECTKRRGFVATLSHTDDNPEFGLTLQYHVITGIPEVAVRLSLGAGVTCDTTGVVLSVTHRTVYNLICTRPAADSITRRIAFNTAPTDPVTNFLLVPPPRRATADTTVRPAREFRYYRFEFPAAAPGARHGHLAFTELRVQWDDRWARNAMTGCAEGTIGGIPATIESSNDTCERGVWASWMAFDGRPRHGRGFFVWNSYPASLTVSLEIPKRISRYAIRSSPCSGREAPRSWRVLGSNDRLNWKELHVESNQAGWPHDPHRCYDAPDQERIFTIPAP